MYAASPVTVTISNASGYAIPDDFIGLSFETSVILANPNKIPRHEPFYFFSPTNRPLISFFKTLGIRNLRVGGGTVDKSKRPLPGPADMDQLFAFAKDANVKVIFSFRLLRGDPQVDASLAKYIWQQHRSQLDCFAIGNEPDWRSYHRMDPRITNYPTYLADWRNFATVIRAAAPEAKFAGPDTGSDYPVQGAGETDYQGKSWTQLFADDEKTSGLIGAVCQHDYPGGQAKNVSMSDAINAMLSPRWVSVEYPALYGHALAPVLADGLPYRLTECNDYLSGVNGASNAFASALWALDYMHWWAEHGCAGVNFHNNEWLRTDTVYLDSDGICHINPKAYGIKAFDLGSHGNVAPLTISNPDNLNLTAYAVRNADKCLVTIINKEYNQAARAATVTIVPDVPAKSAEVMSLTGTLDSKTGVTLGGAEIGNNGSWNGTWTSVHPNKNGQFVLAVPPASAAIVKISAN